MSSITNTSCLHCAVTPNLDLSTATCLDIPYLPAVYCLNRTRLVDPEPIMSNQSTPAITYHTEAQHTKTELAASRLVTTCLHCHAITYPVGPKPNSSRLACLSGSRIAKSRPVFLTKSELNLSGHTCTVLPCLARTNQNLSHRDCPSRFMPYLHHTARPRPVVPERSPTFLACPIVTSCTMSRLVMTSQPRTPRLQRSVNS